MTPRSAREGWVVDRAYALGCRLGLAGGRAGQGDGIWLNEYAKDAVECLARDAMAFADANPLPLKTFVRPEFPVEACDDYKGSVDRPAKADAHPMAEGQGVVDTINRFGTCGQCGEALPDPTSMGHYCLKPNILATPPKRVLVDEVMKLEHVYVGDDIQSSRAESARCLLEVLGGIETKGDTVRVRVTEEPGEEVSHG